MLYACLEFSISKKYFEGQRVSLKGTSSFSTECKELGSCHCLQTRKCWTNWKSTTSLGSNNTNKKRVEWNVSVEIFKKYINLDFYIQWYFKSKGEIKTVSEKQKLRKFIASKPALQENVKRSSSGRRKMI